ncbi:MAG: hypothetical protein WCV88_03370 [Patescibacteria group bacterium]|jgi:hypothetical protein
MFLGGVIIVSIILRVWQLSGQSFWIDESFSISTAQSIIEHGWPVVWRSSLYHYLLAGTSIFVGYRMLSVITGVGMVGVGYIIAKKWFSPIVGLITSVLFATATIEIAWSRQARMYMLLQLCFWLSLYLYQQYRQKNIQWYWPILLTIITISIHEFGIALLLFYFWYEIIKKYSPKLVLIYIISTTILTGLVYHFIFPVTPYVNYWWHYLYYFFTTYYVFIVLMCIGIGVAVKQHKQLVYWFISILLGWLIILSFIVPLLQYRYLFIVLPIMYIFSSVGIVWLWKKSKLVVLLAVIILIWQNQITLIPKTNYWLESDSVNSPFTYKSITPQPNFKAAYKFLSDYPNENIITPYPSIHKLYTGQLPKSALFISLTGGTYPDRPDKDTYTGVPYQTPQAGDVVIVDDFAEQQITINNKELLWEDVNSAPWSGLRIYRILAE